MKKEVKLDKKTLQGLENRLKDTLSLEDYYLICRLIKVFLKLQSMVVEGQASIRRLKNLFKPKTEKLSKKRPEKEPPKKDNPPCGHGHRPAKDYTQAKTIKVDHDSLKKRDLCPHCKQGKLYELKPGSLLHIKGQPWLLVEIYQPQRLRCAKCGDTFTAPLPQNVSLNRADSSAKAVVSLLKYHAGVPFYRQSKVQNGLGTPISATELWEMTREVAWIARPIFSSLCFQAAQGHCIHNDDTNVRILSLMRENLQHDPERKGMFTTSLLSKVGERQIALFFSGRKHAGENLTQLLQDREEEEVPIQVCDGASRNLPSHPTHVAKCLAHARRKFFELADLWPQEITQILGYFSQLFNYDHHTKDWEPNQRLTWHKEHSTPLMKELHAYCQELIDQKRVEPNSSLGRAIAYLHKHWEGLTLFLKLPSVPLTNNENERLIKLAVLNRKNGYFFKTETGAEIGDILTSLIGTCQLNGINPYDYFLELQKHREEVFSHPEKWLPWNYPQSGTDPPD